jgi:hypothetical protein
MRFRVRRTAGCAGSYRWAIRSLPRSIASRYWMRSFVPTLKKEHCFSEEVDRGRGARDLDHRPDLDVLVEGLAPRAQLGLAFLEERVGLRHLLGRR